MAYVDGEDAARLLSLKYPAGMPLRHVSHSERNSASKCPLFRIWGGCSEE